MDEANRFRHVLSQWCAELLPHWRGDLAFGRRRDRVLQFLYAGIKFARKTRDVDQRGSKIVGDDMGEALNLLVGAREIRGAMFHTLLEFRIDFGDLITGV